MRFLRNRQFRLVDDAVNIVHIIGVLYIAEPVSKCISSRSLPVRYVIVVPIAVKTTAVEVKSVGIHIKYSGWVSRKWEIPASKS